MGIVRLFTWVALEFSSLVCILIALSTKAFFPFRPLLQFKRLLPFSGTAVVAALFHGPRISPSLSFLNCCQSDLSKKSNG